MKLFTVTSRYEGELYPQAVFSMGKCFLSEGKFDGWYLKIELPFNKMRSYISPKTFEPTVGKCNWAMLLRKRPMYSNVFKVIIWVPMGEVK